jgi:hypothetical protein
MRKMLAVVLLAVCAGALVPGCGTYREPPTEAQKAGVRNGMSMSEVEQLLGPADGGAETYWLSGETVLGWRIPVRFAGIRASYFNVHFRGDSVVRTSESHEYISIN